MGKIDEQLPLHQHQIDHGASNGGNHQMGVCRMCKNWNFKCFFILILAVSVFASAIFWVLPKQPRKLGFDAKDEIKNSATVQACFRLQKPVSLLVPHIARLEYDINEEIGVPSTKVAILSMHRDPVRDSNWTNVMFGFLSDPMNVPINKVYLSLLRSSLIGLFFQQYNLTLTNSTFGLPSSFEILKFPGGITVIPGESPSILQIPQIFFTFTLHNLIDEIRENYVQFKKQLTLGLHLTPNENIYVQVTNENGSTIDPPLIVQVSVKSDQGSILPQRLKQLAQTITGSPAKNLGLDHSVFGKVKQISLSSYLNSTLHVPPPTSSPAPSPEPYYYVGSPYSPSYPLRHVHYLPPCLSGCNAPSPGPTSGPRHSLSPKSNSPTPSMIDAHSPGPSAHYGFDLSPSPLAPAQPNPLSPTLSPHSSSPLLPPTLMGPTSQMSPGHSHLPVESYGPSPGQDKGNGKGSVAPLTSSSYAKAPPFKTRMFLIFVILTFHNLLPSS